MRRFSFLITALLLGAIAVIGGVTAADDPADGPALDYVLSVPAVANDVAHTPPAGATPTPSAEAPTPEPDEVYLRNVGHRVNNVNDTWLHGEVVNPTDAPVGVAMTAEFFDEDGASVGADEHGGPYVHSIPAGGSAPFGFFLSHIPSATYTIDFEVSDALVEPLATGLELAVTRSTNGAAAGTLTNTIDTTFDAAQVVMVEAFDDGTIYTVVVDMIDEPIEPGSVHNWSFDNLFFAESTDAANRRFWVRAFGDVPADPDGGGQPDDDGGPDLGPNVEYDSMIAGGGVIQLIGEVHNPFDHAIGNVSIDANILVDGEVEGQPFGFADLDVIPAGGSSPFRILFPFVPPGHLNYEITGTSWNDNPGPAITAVAGEVTNTLFGGGGERYEIGWITSTAESDYLDPQVIITYHNAQGRVIGRVGRSYEGYLRAGQRLPFRTQDLSPGAYAERKIWIDASHPIDPAPVQEMGLFDVSVYEDSGQTRAVGILANTGGHAREVWAELVMVDAEGTLLDVVAASPLIDLVPGPGNAPFMATFLAQPPAGAQYALVVRDWIDVPFAFVPDLGVVSNPLPDFEDYIESGAVSNSSPYRHTSTTAWVAIFDHGGKILRLTSAEVQPNTLDPGDDGFFVAVFEGAAGLPVGSALTWFDADLSLPLN